MKKGITVCKTELLLCFRRVQINLKNLKTIVREKKTVELTVDNIYTM